VAQGLRLTREKWRGLGYKCKTNQYLLLAVRRTNQRPLPIMSDAEQRAEAETATGRLVILKTEEARQPIPLYLAWRTGQKGKALQWFVSQLRPQKD
jgi:DNA-binding transcriptional LysR family regulator